MQSIDLIVKKGNFSEAKCVETPLPELEAGQLLLKIDQFAFTANNVTYAVSGDFLRYWDFFPAPEGWGRIPVWGFADVIESMVDDLPIGERVYGYLPMSTHLIVTPGRISPATFMDDAPHRQHLSPIYNQLTRVVADPTYHQEDEALISLFRPLFTTSFLLNEYEVENNYFGAEAIILTSASSKTAIGTAFALKQSGSGRTLIGLTSPSNISFVESLGIYDSVLAYDALETLPIRPAALIDFAGNAGVITRIHNHYQDHLKDSCLVGITHWQDFGRQDETLPGPKPAMFFAPKYAQGRVRAWGVDEFQARLGQSWGSFIPHTRDWITVETHQGQAAALAAYQSVFTNQTAPSVGHIVSVAG